MDHSRAIRWALVIFLAFTLCLIAGISLFLSIKAAQHAGQSFGNFWLIALLLPLLTSISCFVPYVLAHEIKRLLSELKTLESLDSDVELEEQDDRDPEHGSQLQCLMAAPSRSPSEPESASYALYNWVDGLPSASPSLFSEFYQGYHEYPPVTEYSGDSGYSQGSESICPKSELTLVASRADPPDYV